MRRSQTVFEPTSTPLEDRVPVTFRLVGSQQWFANDFEPRAVHEEEKIVISDPVQLQPILAEIRRMPMIGVDIETTGPYHPEDKGYGRNPINEDCRIVLLQIGSKDKVWIIQPALIEHFRDILENTDQLHLAHHWAYDFKWLLVKNEIHPCRLYCSMLAEQLLTAGKLGYKVGLADCARRYKPYWIVSKAVRSKFSDLGDGKMTRQMVKYAARDIALLFPVYHGQVKELEEYDMFFVAQLEFDNIPVTVEMETSGIHFNQDKLKWIVAYWTRLQDAMEMEILKQYTDVRKAKGQVAFIVPEWLDVFDLQSNKEKLEALRNIGVTLGSNDVKRATLLETNDPIAKLLAEYSHVLKMTSTYGDNLLKKINKTGLYYPWFAQLGFGSAGGDGRDHKETTATGRWASDAQQFPRKSDGTYADPFREEERVAAEAKFADLIANIKAKQAQEESNGSVGDEVKLSEKNGTLGVYLGTWWDREWFWNKSQSKIVWRVPEIRECIVAREGYKILAADYSQIEIKLMAFLSKDPEMIRALNAKDASGNPTDIHCYISTMVYGETLKFTYDEMIAVIKEKTPQGKKHPRYKEFKRMRANIKTTTFGVPYGSGAQGVAQRCGITEEEAQQVIDDFFRQFPVLHTWLEEQGSSALRYEYTETPYGRKRFYDPPKRTNDDARHTINTDYDAEVSQINRCAGNHPIQAASVDMLKEALRLIYHGIRGGDIDASNRHDKLNGPKLYDGRIIMVIHDEIVMECREDQVEEVKLLMERCMDKAYDSIIGSVIPNKIDVAVESSWEKA